MRVHYRTQTLVWTLFEGQPFDFEILQITHLGLVMFFPRVQKHTVSACLLQRLHIATVRTRISARLRTWRAAPASPPSWVHSRELMRAVLLGQRVTRATWLKPNVLLNGAQAAASQPHPCKAHRAGLVPALKRLRRRTYVRA